VLGPALGRHPITRGDARQHRRDDPNEHEVIMTPAARSTKAPRRTVR
jgi:hypothetical protein